VSLAEKGSDARLFAGFVMVGAVGFATDAGLLAAGLALHLAPLAARAISVSTALQVTFALNGLLVFRSLSARLFARQWATYMLSNGFGAGCNYVIFAGLTLSRAPVVSERVPAFLIAAAAALLVNYAGTRFLAFRRTGK
jgi:putative flippase GtrA